MGQHIQQTCIGIGHRGTLVLSKLKIVNAGGEKIAADKLQPLLHFIFIYESCLFALSLCGEEHIQVKLVKFALQCYLTNFVGHFVCHHNHSRQGNIWIVCTYPRIFFTLFIGICPVEYLLLDKFTAVYSTERRSRQIEIIACGNGQEGFVICVSRFFRLIFFCIKIRFGFFIGIFKELFHILTPCAEMILVKDNYIPYFGMYKLIFRLDTAVFIGAEQVLKRTENNDRL